MPTALPFARIEHDVADDVPRLRSIEPFARPAPIDTRPLVLIGFTAMVAIAIIEIGLTLYAAGVTAWGLR